jgi:uncharacterized membrane protein
MKAHSISKRLVVAFLLTTLAGTGLHFLYDLLPSPLTALFSPVNESIWEHLKLIYWPYLVAMGIVTRRAGRGSRGPWLCTLLVLSVALLAVGYVYHIVLGGDSMVFDIGLYVVLMALGFWLPGRLSKVPGRSAPLLVLVVLLGVGIALFTFLPPDRLLFTDLSRAGTWYKIPC